MIRWCVTFSAFGTKQSTNLSLRYMTIYTTYHIQLHTHLLFDISSAMRETSATKKAAIVIQNLCQSNQVVVQKISCM